MRTLFEDTDEQADREDDQTGQRLRIYLMSLAALFLAVAVGAYYWVSNRRPPEPPPVAVSLDDPLQVSQTLNRFNGFVTQGNWAEAERLLSADGLKRLAEEKKTLRESLLAERLAKQKDDKVVNALRTPSGSQTPSTVRIDYAYLFADNDQLIVPLTLIKENDRLVVNSW